ncbi:hypothetical protein M758_7G025700 [Ceratodon purpureus]|nr:hypothetical protein M758_7G025700 [Ceratodon purpureus]
MKLHIVPPSRSENMHFLKQRNRLGAGRPNIAHRQYLLPKNLRWGPLLIPQISRVRRGNMKTQLHQSILLARTRRIVHMKLQHHLILPLHLRLRHIRNRNIKRMLTAHSESQRAPLQSRIAPIPPTDRQWLLLRADPHVRHKERPQTRHIRLPKPIELHIAPCLQLHP